LLLILWQNKLLTNYLVTSTVGHVSENEHNSNWDTQKVKQTYYSLLDSVVGEISARFGGSSLDLLQSIEALLPSSKGFMKLAAIKPLAEISCSYKQNH